MTPEQIKSFKAKHHLTAAQLAARLPVSVGTLRGWEMGRPCPTFTARAFNDLDRELSRKK